MSTFEEIKRDYPRRYPTGAEIDHIVWLIAKVERLQAANELLRLSLAEYKPGTLAHRLARLLIGRAEK